MLKILDPDFVFLDNRVMTFKLKLPANFYKNLYVRISLIVILLINLANWLLIYINIKWQSTIVPLHYNIYFGIDWLGAAYNFYFYPLLALVIFLINFFLAWLWWRCQRLVSYAWLMLALLVNIFMLLGSILVLSVNYF